jgi:inositol hexakisphosphate/diphosphoinositol-pentakisphosphate kinase
MEEILHRLEQFEYLRIVIFPEATINEKPIEEWPFSHVLISFHSKGFPLAKAQEYVRLHQPFLINDLDKQWDIMDRIQVHKILDDAGIPQPRYGVLRRQMNDGLCKIEPIE